MSAGSQVSAFFQDIAKSKQFWTIQFEDGQFIKWCNDDGSEVLPLWSTESRVDKTIKRIEEFEGGKPISISLGAFLETWLPDLIETNVSIGPNWAGENLSGRTYAAVEIIQRLENTEGF